MFSARALGVQSLEPGEYHIKSTVRLLFATSRRVDLNVENVARSRRGGSIRYENIFTTTLDPSLAYGWIDVSYPKDRESGSQHYSNFSIERFGVVGSSSEARNLVKNRFPNSIGRSLVYVHGINNSFLDGIQHLTQLVVDLDIQGAPLLFSWPSDAEILPIVDSYKKTFGIAKKSEPYLSRAIDDILDADVGRFDLIAHSMGTVVVFDMLRERPLKGVGTLDPSNPPLVALPNLVFAAPDIGVKEFAAGREELRRKVRRLAIYCSADRALLGSRVLNGDDRVGYCNEAKQRKDYMDGVEFVRVFGNFRDLASHSYYINHPAVLADIRTVLTMYPPTPRFMDLIPVPYREIFLK